ncbi:MAG: tetratricopeptide repeat protein [Sandaracinaceae bacterium]
MRASALGHVCAAMVTTAVSIGPSPGGVVQAQQGASSEDDNPLLARGASEFEDLRFEEALQTLSAALLRAETTQEDRAVIYRLLAYTYLALGREPEAAGAYRRLLPLDPEFEPGPEVSPPDRAFFTRVRAAWEDEGRPGSSPPPPVDIQHRSPAQADAGEPVDLEASVVDPGLRVARLVLAYRQGTEAVFRRLDTAPDGEVRRATIPADDVLPPLVEYYFEAVDGRGLPIASRGDVAAPLRIAVPEATGGGVLAQWWFWTIVGLVVAGGVATAVALAATSGSQGTVVVTVR